MKIYQELQRRDNQQRKLKQFRVKYKGTVTRDARMNRFSDLDFEIGLSQSLLFISYSYLFFCIFTELQLVQKVYNPKSCHEGK